MPVMCVRYVCGYVDQCVQRYTCRQWYGFILYSYIKSKYRVMDAKM